MDDPLPVSASIARRQVNVVTLERVSNLLLADEPALTQEAGKWVWRVPIDLTFPSHGRVGRVGELDVDAQNGNVTVDDSRLEEIRRKANRLAKHVLGS